MLLKGFHQLHKAVWLILPPITIFSIFLLILSTFISNIWLSMAVAAGLTGATVWLGQVMLAKVDVAGIHLPTAKVIIGVGILLKLLVFFLFPVEFVSDGATYSGLANKLIDGKSYEAGGTFAYWPPGYPFFLYGTHLGLFKVTTTSVFVINCIVMVISSLLIYQLVQKLANKKAALWSLIFFTLWPTGILGVVGAFKELVLMMFILLSLYIYCVKASVGWNFLNGLILGFCALIQPGSMLIVSVFLVTNWVKKQSWLNQAAALILLVVGMACVISPWSYRNLQVFNEPVFISTNGGSNMYRANNEIATGGYMKTGKVDISHLSELEQNKKGKELALEWIGQHKIDFLSLSLVKITRFLGDDSTGGYTTLKRGAITPINEVGYYLTKLVANGYWLLMWLIIFSARKIWLPLLKENTYLISMSLSFLYFFTIHAIFESNGKYHVPAFFVIVIMAGVLLSYQNKAGVER